MRRWLLAGLAPLVGAGLFLLGVAALGKLAREHVRDQERYTLAFADIDCEPPPGQERDLFLAEVFYDAGLPERLRLLDDGLAARLAEAFARHPWVEKVERVEVTPPRQVRVRLAYRTPALAVQLADQTRVVDGRGVLLPPRAGAAGLPVLAHRGAPPAVPSGSTWEDAAVQAAARTAACLLPRQEQLKLTTIQVTPEGEVVCGTTAGTRVLWGHAPGAEAEGETPAARKLERLAEYCQAHGGLDAPDGPRLHDVRR